MLEAGEAQWSGQTPEWFEERFWIWVHYAAMKIGHGELFEALDMFAYAGGCSGPFSLNPSGFDKMRFGASSS